MGCFYLMTIVLDWLACIKVQQFNCQLRPWANLNDTGSTLKINLERAVKNVDN